MSQEYNVREGAIRVLEEPGWVGVYDMSGSHRKFLLKIDTTKNIVYIPVTGKFVSFSIEEARRASTESPAGKNQGE